MFRLRHRVNNNTVIRHPKLGMTLFRFTLYLFLSVLALNPSFAKPVHNANKQIEYLAEEKVNLTLANNEAKLLTEPNDQAALSLRKQQNKAMLALIAAKISSLESFLSNQRKQQQDLASHLKKLQQSPLDKSHEIFLQERIAKINTLDDVNNKTIELISENLALARDYQQRLLAEHGKLELWQAKMHEQQVQHELRQKIHQLDEARNQLYQKNVDLQKEKKADTSFNANFTNEAKLFLNNQSIILLQLGINELQLQRMLSKEDYLLVKNRDVKSSQSIIDTYKNALNQLSNMQQALRKMVELLKNEQLTLADNNLKQQFFIIEKTASLRLEQITAQKQSLQDNLATKQKELTKQLAMRKGMPEYHPESWPVIANQLIAIPSHCYHYLKALALKVKENYVWQDVWLAVLEWCSLALILLTAFGLSWVLRAVTQNKERYRLSAHLFGGVLVLLQRNVAQLAILAVMLATFTIQNIPFPKYQLLINLMLVWLTFRNLILIARIMLLERISDVTGQDVRLYYRLKWLLIVGGWATALMVLSHQLPLTLMLQDIFNRLFMLFLLAVSLVLWKSNDVIPYLLWPFLKTKKRYFRNAISLLAVLVPLILFTTALIGLVGYIDLAWNLSRYQADLLLVITSYVLARGLIFDALELLSEWMISTLRNGWLWIEVILKPLDTILRVFLLIISIVILFQLFGWYSDSFVMACIKKFGHYPLVDISGVHITFISIVEFLILLFTFIWASKWTREFCYRWLYRNSRDAGIRNSLSVFTQYAVVLIGGFITLRVLGLDFSGMAMVLGGLAVGMGFGLRDFASNIVGGIMLLIERPVREGDVITLGEYEGRVAHIGIRSMRVSSWDNMEVLIPNAETFSKPFTNWTHQDSVVRTVVPIKVSRADDPAMIQQLILNVLATIPEILTSPSPQVLLKQIDDALIEFEVRYFINVQLYTRFEIRSKALFAITEEFKRAGVKAPIPPFTVELIEK